MDIDIDFPTIFDPKNCFPTATRASMVKNNELFKHPVGIYFQNIPKDPVTDLSAIPYEQAEDLGYVKIDFLHLNLLDYFETKHQIRTLMNTEPDWFLLESAETVKKLFQIHNHYDIVQQIKPKSVEELSDTIALIRPGKRHLLKAYLKNKDDIRLQLYQKPEDGSYYYKRSHALAYAFNIVLQLHLIKGKII